MIKRMKQIDEILDAGTRLSEEPIAITGKRNRVEQ